MGRGNDPGKDFDDQYYTSRREGRGKAARGEGPWADDKYLARINDQARRDRNSGGRHRAESEGCADKAVVLLGLLGGAAWGLAEVAGRVI
jgi:hypothetical protein